MPFAATWGDLEIIILSEISQTEKDKYQVISHVKFNKKWYKRTYLKKKKKLQGFKTHLVGTIGKTIGGGKNWEGGNNTYTPLYKTDD